MSMWNTTSLGNSSMGLSHGPAYPLNSSNPTQGAQFQSQGNTIPSMGHLGPGLAHDVFTPAPKFGHGDDRQHPQKTIDSWKKHYGRLPREEKQRLAREHNIHNANDYVEYKKGTTNLSDRKSKHNKS